MLALTPVPRHWYYLPLPHRLDPRHHVTSCQAPATSELVVVSRLIMHHLSPATERQAKQRNSQPLPAPPSAHPHDAHPHAAPPSPLHSPGTVIPSPFLPARLLLSSMRRSFKRMCRSSTRLCAAPAHATPPYAARPRVSLDLNKQSCRFYVDTHPLEIE